MNISRLTNLSEDFSSNWGSNGYVTTKVFLVTIDYNPSNITIKLDKTDRLYEKTYQIKPEDILYFNKLIKKQNSFGAMEMNELIGILICDQRKWNNSVYIENILISEAHRRKGVGKKLIEHAIEKCEQDNCRIIEVETQNTNFPAIEFYSTLGFKITGVNMKLYKESSSEVALFMTYENQDHKQKD